MNADRSAKSIAKLNAACSADLNTDRSVKLTAELSANIDLQNRPQNQTQIPLLRIERRNKRSADSNTNALTKTSRTTPRTMASALWILSVLSYQCNANPTRQLLQQLQVWQSIGMRLLLESTDQVQADALSDEETPFTMGLGGKSGGLEEDAAEEIDEKRLEPVTTPSFLQNKCVTRKWGQVQCLKVVWWLHGYVTSQTHDYLFIVVIALGCIQK